MKKISGPSLPLSVLKFFRRMGQPHKSRALGHLMRRIESGEVVETTLADVNAALAFAADEYFRDQDMRPNPEKWNRAMSDYVEGKWATLRDVIDELRNSAA